MVKVQVGEMKRFVAECLRAAGAKVQPSREQAELVTYADLIGFRRHGIQKLYEYVNDIKNGVCKPNNNPQILKEQTSTAWVDGKGVMGATAGGFAMELAIKKANDTGVGWVAIKGFHDSAEPYCYWSHKAANNGLVGVVFSNTSSIQQTPAKEEKAFTSLKKPTYIKASALASMVNLSETSPDEDGNSWLDEPLAQSPGHSFVAINPACFALGFDGQQSPTTRNLHWTQIDTMDPKLLEVPLVDLETQSASEFREGDMLSYELKQINAIIELAVKLNVKPMQLHDNEEILG